jgi:hypothetical protein
MKQRGRRSAAQLSVIAGTIDGRPKAPPSLSADETEVWDRIVASEAADLFRTAAIQGLLTRYCRHFCRAEWLEKEIRTATLPHSEDSLADVDRLMKMAQRETLACVTIATKLRLTNQSRYQPSVAATAARRASSERKLWQRPV